MKTILTALALATASLGIAQGAADPPVDVRTTDGQQEATGAQVAQGPGPVMRVTFNGQALSMPGQPRMFDGVAFVPMRQVLEQTGFERIRHDWRRDVIVAWRGTDKVEFMPNSRMMRVNDMLVVAEEAPLQIRGQLLMPLDTLAFLTGADLVVENGTAELIGQRDEVQRFNISPPLGAGSLPTLRDVPGPRGPDRLVEPSRAPVRPFGGS
jgi:hypothetical protein